MEIRGEDVAERLKKVEDELYLLSKPNVYGGKKGLIVKIESDFEGECIVLQQQGISNPKKSTVFEFYRAVGIIKQQHKSNGKSKRHKRHNTKP